jgi:hypothetical protein
MTFAATRAGRAALCAAVAGVLAVAPALAADARSAAPVPPSPSSTSTSSASAVGFEPNQQSNVETAVVDAAVAEGFWENSTLRFEPRSYLLNRDRDTKADVAGWALGGALKYRSGWWRDSVKLAATVHTSQELWGPEDKDGTQLFKPGPTGFTVLSELNVTWRFGENEGVRVGRQSLELPYLGSHDIRMVPNTFEAIAVGRQVSTGFAYMAGYVDGIKRKNDDRFVSMSEAAGVRGGNDGLAFAGAQYVFDDGTLVGAINQHTFDVFNTLFAKVEKKFPLGMDASVKGFLQYTDQRSTGRDLIGEFETSLLAAKVEYKRGPATLRAGASTTGSDKGIQKPYGNPANYLSVIVDDFDRAGENAWLIGATYDFGRVGPGDLSTFANVVSGTTPDAGPNASPDETEYDLTLDWRLKEGWPKNLWLRVRAAYIDQDEREGGDDFVDVRLIVNYSFAVP